MTSIIKVDNIQDQGGGNIINESGNTVTIGKSGDTVNIVGTLQNNGGALPGDITSVVAGTGLSGGGTSGAVTINIEAAQPTITSLGTLTSATISGDLTVDTDTLKVDSSNNRVFVNGTGGTRELNVNGDNTRLLLYSTNNSTGAGQLQFGDADNEQIGRIMYEHNSNHMTFHTNATEKMKILSSGNVGIGTSSPSATVGTDKVLEIAGSVSPGLVINDTGQAEKYQLYADSTKFKISYGSTNFLTYNASGSFLGIGTVTPSATLTVNDAGGAFMQLERTGQGHLFLSTDGTNGTIRTSTSNGALRFQTNGNNERMRIDSSGNVGIGNTVPGDFNSQAKNLVIGGGSGDTGMTIYSGSSSGDTGNIFFADGTSGSDQVRGGITYNHGDNSMNFRTNDGANRIYISSAGNVGIGNNAPVTKLHIGDTSTGSAGSVGKNIVSSQDFSSTFSGSSAATWSGLQLVNHDDTSNRTTTGVTFVHRSSGSGIAGIISTSASADRADIRFITRGTNNTIAERAQISDDGNLFVNNTSEPSQGSNGAMISATLYHTFCRNNSGAAVLRAFGSAGEFRAIGNGNVQNTNNSYGAISDRVLKENEVDASSQWNDVKALQIKHYNFKLKPNEKQLGVIAQDLEASGMNGLVENNQDELYTEDDVLPEGKNIGDVRLKNYKSVKYSILYMKSVKALQEAMERIETLEAKVTALETTTP